MKHPFLMAVFNFCVFSQYTFSQETVENPEKYTAHNKGKFYIFWEVIANHTLNQMFDLKGRLRLYFV